MRTQIIGVYCNEIIDLPESESDFYHELAKFLVKQPPQQNISVSCEKGMASYKSEYRSGTLTIFNLMNMIRFSQADKYPDVYLTCIDRESNKYKFYKLEQNGQKVIATYGRIGNTVGELFGERTYTYEPDMFWIKYEEKIAKGYVDQSAYFYDRSTSSFATQSPNQNIPKATTPTAASQSLFKKLMSFSKRIVQSACVTGSVTPGMAKRSRELLTELYQISDLTEFNKKLDQLLTLVPRKVIKVASLYATSKYDFATIIDREENLVSAMESMVLGTKKQSTGYDSSFEDLHIHVDTASDKEEKNVLSLLNNGLDKKVVKVYKITNSRHNERFENYCKKRKITNTKLLWHGSRNENWLSIIENGLLLNPNAIITGKMFGNGIYFAPKSSKSWNYTSIRGSYWAGGNSNTAFMGVYETAYGTPLNVTSAHSYTERTLGGKDCVHAHAGSSLINDEIIFYNESAMVLRYIVEFAA